MTKGEFIKFYANKMDISQADARKHVDGFMDCVKEVLLEEDKLSFTGFGAFEIKHRKARMGRNPRKPEEEIEIKAYSTPVFKAGKTFKDDIKASRA